MKNLCRRSSLNDIWTLVCRLWSDDFLQRLSRYRSNRKWTSQSPSSSTYDFEKASIYYINSPWTFILYLSDIASHRYQYRSVYDDFEAYVTSELKIEIPSCPTTWKCSIVLFLKPLISDILLSTRSICHSTSINSRQKLWDNFCFWLNQVKTDVASCRLSR